MHVFLVDTEIATKGLFGLLFREEERLGVARLGAAYAADDHRGVQALLAQAQDNPHLRALQPFYEREAADSQDRVDALAARIARMHEDAMARTVSVGAIAGAILQIAKQGIRIGQPTGRADRRTGRLVGRQALRTVIWEARNQAMHWEEGSYRRPLEECFAVLVADFGTGFSLDPPRSLAKAVVDILGWLRYENYVNDMETLIG